MNRHGPHRSACLKGATSGSEAARITCATLNDIVQSLLDEVSDYRHGAFSAWGIAGNKETVRTERGAEAALATMSR